MSDYTPKREKDTIDAAVTSASKVPGSLTLNELNAISDKGLVVSGGGESVVEQDFDYVLRAIVPTNPELEVVSGNGVELFNDLDSSKQDLSSGYWNMNRVLAYTVNSENGKVGVFGDCYFDTADGIIFLKLSEGSTDCFIFHPDGTFEYSGTTPGTTPDEGGLK